MINAGDIFCRSRIIPTEQRIAVVKLILALEKSPFSVNTLRDQIQAAALPVSQNTLLKTLQLLVARKILRAFPAPGNGKKKGRPMTMYIIDPGLMSEHSASAIPHQPGTQNHVKGIDFH